MQKIFYLNLQITTNSVQIPYNIVQNLYKKRITSFYRVLVNKAKMEDILKGIAKAIMQLHNMKKVMLLIIYIYYV